MQHGVCCEWGRSSHGGQLDLTTKNPGEGGGGGALLGLDLVGAFGQAADSPRDLAQVVLRLLTLIGQACTQAARNSVEIIGQGTCTWTCRRGTALVACTRCRLAPFGQGGCRWQTIQLGGIATSILHVVSQTQPSCGARTCDLVDLPVLDQVIDDVGVVAGGVRLCGLRKCIPNPD